MKPAPVDYAAPATVAEAIELLSSDEDAKALAGGQSLVPLLALRLARPTLLVDLNKIASLNTVTTHATGVRFGAMVRQDKLVGLQEHPMIGAAAGWIAHAAIRSRGTFGGSLAHADSAAELPVVATALGASIEATGPRGARTIEADHFFHGLLQTDLSDNELLTAIDCPLPERWGFAELARRQGDFALVLVAVAKMPAVISSERASEPGWRIVVGGVEGAPRRCRMAEEAMAAGELLEAARLAGIEIEASDHLHATATYQRGMTTELVSRALDEAMNR